jgi:membrane fusion protein (multidrug efflux system)
LRLDGFPWTQFGSLAATVTRVASEARDGQVRVELHLASPGGRPDIPMQHGLPGTVEIHVEEITPLVLIVRAAGRLVNP